MTSRRGAGKDPRRRAPARHLSRQGDVAPSAPLTSVIEAAASAPVTMVIGASDTGKTTLVAALASALAARGLSVGVVDADVGQSEIGPPTTIGLGRVRRALGRLAEAELVAMHFVGVTSPAANLAGVLVGTRKMLDRARSERFERVLIDTSGLVAGELGRMLKQAKIDLLEPALVICLQRGGECRHILQPYAGARRPTVLTLPAAAAARGRSADERRRRRERALASYFAGARPVTVDLGRVILRRPALFWGAPLGDDERRAVSETSQRSLLWGERQGADVTVVTEDRLEDAEARRLARRLGAAPLAHYAMRDLRDALAGLHDAGGATLGLGVVRAIDFGRHALALDTTVPVTHVAGVTIGRETYGVGGSRAAPSD